MDKFVVLMILFAVICVIFAPFVFIWTINVLFHTKTPYNLQTWFASLLFIAALKSTTTTTK